MFSSSLLISWLCEFPLKVVFKDLKISAKFMKCQNIKLFLFQNSCSAKKWIFHMLVDATSRHAFTIMHRILCTFCVAFNLSALAVVVSCLESKNKIH